MERRWKALVLIGIILGSVSIVAFVSWTTHPVVRIGYLTGDLHQLALFVAQDQGYFEEEGLTVEFTQFENGNYEMVAFAGDLIDMGYLGIAPALMHRINANTAITILAAVNLEGSGIIANQNVTHFQDLFTGVVATPGPGTVQDVLLAIACNQTGLDYTQIQSNITHTFPYYMETQLAAGDLTGFVAWEPYPSLSLDHDVGYLLNTSNDIWPNHPCCMLAVRNSFLSTRPDIVSKVVAVHRRATEFIQNNFVEAVGIGVNWTGYDVDVISSAMTRIIFSYQIDVAGVATYLNWLIYFNYVEGISKDEIDPFLNEFINTQYIEE